MTKNKILVIIESPGKIDKISHILGSEYIVKASVGHIIDLKKIDENIYPDFSKKFEPIYEIIFGKGDIVNKLKQEVKKANKVLIATDADREGCQIAWSLAKELKIDNPKRIIFTAITEKVITDSLKHPVDIDKNLVNSQHCRRILDIGLGFRLSPILWKQFNSPRLSAGRVQSPVVRLIVEKENEINNFFMKSESSYFRFIGLFEKLKAILYKNKKVAEVEIENGKILLEKIIKSELKVMSVVKKQSIRHANQPFTTTSLQQECASKLGFSANRTMQSAQHLYENGYITYHRTDSPNITKDALIAIGKYIINKFGEEYHEEKTYKSKQATSQESHEAIRITDPKLEVLEESKKNIGSDEIRLYNLIWRRTIASQMTPAKFDVTTVIIGISKLKDYHFVLQFEKLIFLGFLKVYNLINIEDTKLDDTQIAKNNKKFKKGAKLDVKEIVATQEYEKPPLRYSEATLIKTMEKYEIGRPSTTAVIIEKIKKNYVKKEDIEGIEKESIILKYDGKKIIEETNKIMLGKEHNKFIPTEMGILVTEFLIKSFPKIMDYKFTSEMEKKLDKIAEGKADWRKVLKEFFEIVDPMIDKIKKDKKTFISEHSKSLGIHPETKEEIIATIGKYGAMLKMGKKYAPIKPPLTIKTITLEDAIKIFEYPKTLGKFNKKNVYLNRGKYGLYLRFGENETLAILNEVDIDEAIKLIKEKLKKYLWMGKDKKNTYTVLNGKYGTYVKVKSIKNKKTANYKIPDDTKIEELNIDKINEIIKNALQHKRRRFVKKTIKTE